MTITSESSGPFQYTANGVTTDFTFSNRLMDESHVAVYVDGVLQTITTHYTVTLLASTATISFVAAPADQAVVTLAYDIPLTQLVDYIPNGKFLASNSENGLDQLTLIAIQMQEELDRCLKVGRAETGVSGITTTLPAPSANATLVWNASGDAIINGSNPFATVGDHKVFATVAAMVADATHVVGDIVETAGYITTDDGGGNMYEVVVAATGTADGGSFIDGTGVQFKGLFPNGSVNVKQFGAVGDGVTDDTASFQSASEYAGDVLYIPDGNYVTTDQPSIADSVLSGEGELISAYRDGVNRVYYQTADAKNGIVAKRHLRRFSLTDSPTVAIVGDSISTESPTIAHSENDSMWGIIQERMLEDNPDSSITFINRAIGGATWTSANPATNLNATGLALPSWAGAGSSPWLTYVESQSPDVVFLSFGMNDRQNFVTAQFRAVVTNILSWSKVPDIVFITPMVPSRESADTGISSRVSQEGRDFVAGYVRSYAKYAGFGLVDLNQQLCIKRDGFDPTASYIERQSINKVSGATTYTVDTDKFCHDFGWDIDFSSIPAGFWDGSGSGNMRFWLSPYSPDFPNSTSWMDIVDNGGFIDLKFYDVDDGPGNYLTVATGFSTPGTGSDVNLKVFLKDNSVFVEMGGTVLHKGIIRRHGGQFLPKFGFTDGFSYACSLFFYRGRYVRHMPTLTDKDMWGEAGQGGIVGGNDLNHPTSKGSATVIRSCFNQIDFRQPVIVEGNTDFPATQERKAGLGTAFPKGFMHITKTPATSDVPASNANNLVIEDATSAGMTFMANSTGVCRVNFGDENDNDAGYILHNHTAQTTTIGSENSTITMSNQVSLDSPIRPLAEDGVPTLPGTNRILSFALTSNTNLRIYCRGNDGAMRSVDLTLS
jgi:hypothetical protein